MCYFSKNQQFLEAMKKIKNQMDTVIKNSINSSLSDDNSFAIVTQSKPKNRLLLYSLSLDCLKSIETQ